MAFTKEGSMSFFADSVTGIAKGLRVKLGSDAQHIVPADADDLEIGVTESMASNNKTPVGVRLRNAPGTIEVRAGGAFASGATVKKDDDGKVDDGAAGANYGTALSDAAAEDDLVEILPL